MSRAKKWLKREKSKAIEIMGDETINCPNCGIPVPNKVFLKGDMGRNYNCAVCGKNVYAEWVEKVFNKT